MGNKIEVNRVTNANVYVDGNSFLGRASEIDLPDVAAAMSEHEAVGMIGAVEFFSGIETMEASISWNSFYKDVYRAVGNPTKSLKLQVRSSIETYTDAGRSAELPLVIHLTGQPKNFPLGTFSQQENVELESSFNITYVKLLVDGADMFEFDALANILKIDGEDIMANYRANLGID